MNTEKGEFFGAMNLPVHYWLLERKHNGLPSLKEVDNFCVVNEELFNEYDFFKCSYNKQWSRKMNSRGSQRLVMIEETPKMGSGGPPPRKKLRKLIGAVRWTF